MNNLLFLSFQLAAKNSPELNELGTQYGAGWEMRIPLMKRGGCPCKPSEEEQRLLDEQHHLDDEDPDPSTLFLTEDDLLHIWKVDLEDPMTQGATEMAVAAARNDRRRIVLKMMCGHSRRMKRLQRKKIRI